MPKLTALLYWLPLLCCACVGTAWAQAEEPAAGAEAGAAPPPGFVLRYELAFPAYVGANPTDVPGVSPQELYNTVKQWVADHGGGWDGPGQPIAQWFDREYTSKNAVLTSSVDELYLLNSDDPALLADLIEATSHIEFCKLAGVSEYKFYYAQQYPEYFSAPHTVTVDGIVRNFPWDCIWAQQERLFDRIASRRGKGVPEWSAGSLAWLAGPECKTTAFRVEMDAAGNLIITTIATKPLVPGWESPADFICLTIPQQHSMDTDEEALRSLVSGILRQYLPEGEQEPDGASWVDPQAFEVRVPLLPEETWLAALRGDIPGDVDPATRLLMTARSDELKKVFEDWLLTHPELRDEIGLSKTGYARDEMHIFDLDKRDYMPLAFVGTVYTSRQDIKDELMALMRASQDIHEPLLCPGHSSRLQRDWPPTV
jgi:hypothetical protein